ncbi:uncharacterized protein RJT20DRAFT_131151 [Scheffersomyces xylosifermentans]|uniref:uncharacterized protein n=1 Tax=Scheffersomyces xylosifermentans TaxID=1304137 RepID=UPI00315C609A
MASDKENESAEAESRKPVESSLDTPEPPRLPDTISHNAESLNSLVSPDEEEEEYYEEDDEVEEMPVDFSSSTIFEGNHSTASLSRRLSRNDASSIVGGQSLDELYTKKNAHPIADGNRTTQDQERIAVESPYKDDVIDSATIRDHSQKVFSFDLPFGGLTNIRSNLYKQMQSFRIDSIPIIGNHDIHDEDKEEIRLKLERQQSISTVEEAKYFKKYKGTDDTRFRAVKHSLAVNLLPEFLQNRKDEKSYESIYNEIEGNIVVLGGYRGSILRDTKTKKRVWIPIKAGFNLRKINLLLGPTIDDEINAVKYIYPDGVLKNIGPIDICKRFIKKLDSNPRTNVHEFGYDWRLSGHIISKQLEDFLQKLYDETGKPSLVIAHSMGGLMAHGALQRNPKLFRSIIYVGVPSECLNILGPIRFGDSVILSDKILTYETNFMMRSSFIFLPLSGRVFYNERTKEWYDLDYFDPETWVEYNLNPLVAKERRLLEESGYKSTPLSPSDSSISFPSINSISNAFKNYRPNVLNRKIKHSSLDENSLSSSFTNEKGQKLESTIRSATFSTALRENSTSPSLSSIRSNSDDVDAESLFSFSFSEAYKYLCETLKSTKEYLLTLDFREDLEPEYPPMAMVYGNTVPSVRGSNVRGLQDIKDGNYYEFFYGHGDGVVHQKWLMPQRKGFRFYDNTTGEGEIVGKFASDCGHVSLMTDFKAMGQALCAVVEAEMFWEEKKARLRERRAKKDLPHRNLDSSEFQEV